MAFRMYVDEDGVPFSDYGTYKGLEIGRQRSVLSVAERGLNLWNRFLGEDQPVLLSYDWNRWPENKDREPGTTEEAIRTLLRCADWLLERIVDRGSHRLWLYDYPMSYGTRSGWGSAHAQAVGLQLLVRAHRVTDDHRYIEHIQELVAAFEVPIEHGGLLDPSGGVHWFEKFADPTNERPKVLNGMLFTLIGLHEIAVEVPSDAADRCFQRGLTSVIDLLPRFDLTDWSAYDIKGKRATEHYHRIHIAQLERLHAIIPNAHLAEWRDRFKSYVR